MKTSKEVRAILREALTDLVRDGSPWSREGNSLYRSGVRVGVAEILNGAQGIVHLVNAASSMIADLEDYEKLEADHRLQGEMWERDLGKAQREIDRLRKENEVLKAKARFFAEESVHLLGMIRSAALQTTSRYPVVMMAIAAVRFPGEDTMAALKAAVDKLPNEDE